MTDHIDRLTAFEQGHITDTIKKMAGDLRRSADALDRTATDERLTDLWRVQNAWSEIRNMNSNLRVDILIASLGRLLEIEHERLDSADDA